MDPLGQFARRLPLVARTRPACVPLDQRVSALCDRARHAEHSGDLTEAATVHNNAALIASDCGLPELARRWCHQHVTIYLRARPLSAQVARLALEPIINLARLYIREGQGERAFALVETLFSAVSARADAFVDGIEIPANLTDSTEAHHDIRKWLWAVLLATGGRALAASGRWADARARLDNYNGIGHRMLDGRQITIIAHAVEGDIDSALTLLAGTAPGDPWENAVTSCLTMYCRPPTSPTALDTLLEPYRNLNTAAPGLTVFHLRLGLSFIDALPTPATEPARRFAADLIERTTTSLDGYAARDLLAHPGCRELLTNAQARGLTDLVDGCALDSGTLPGPVLEEVTSALASVEDVIRRGTASSQKALPTPS